MSRHRSFMGKVADRVALLGLLPILAPRLLLSMLRVEVRNRRGLCADCSRPLPGADTWEVGLGERLVCGACAAPDGVVKPSRRVPELELLSRLAR